MDTIEQLLARHQEGFRKRDPKELAADYAQNATVSSPMFPRAEERRYSDAAGASRCSRSCSHTARAWLSSVASSSSF